MANNYTSTLDYIMKLQLTRKLKIFCCLVTTAIHVTKKTLYTFTKVKGCIRKLRTDFRYFVVFFFSENRFFLLSVAYDCLSSIAKLTLHYFASLYSILTLDSKDAEIQMYKQSFKWFLPLKKLIIDVKFYF